jgi:hypothetical protein
LGGDPRYKVFLREIRDGYQNDHSNGGKIEKAVEQFV